MKIIKTVLLFLALLPILSCERDDDDSTQSLDLIGEWQRSDFSDEFEYTLTFQTNDTGFRTVIERDLAEGTEISSLRTFNWVASETTLTLDYDGEIVITPFVLNPNGQLFLSEISEFSFSKVE